jgi:hypothetical protein
MPLHVQSRRPLVMVVIATVAVRRIEIDRHFAWYMPDVQCVDCATLRKPLKYAFEPLGNPVKGFDRVYGEPVKSFRPVRNCQGAKTMSRRSAKKSDCRTIAWLDEPEEKEPASHEDESQEKEQENESQEEAEEQEAETADDGMP